MDKEVVRNISIYMNIINIPYAIIKEKILPFGTTWMEFQGIMVSEISQRKILYDVYVMIS